MSGTTLASLGLPPEVLARLEEEFDCVTQKVATVNALRIEIQGTGTCWRIRRQAIQAATAH